MQLNSIIFPAPSFTIENTLDYEDNLIFIPKTKTNGYIPCFFIPTNKDTVSAKVLMFFHGNAEDIFGAKEIGERIKDKLMLNILIVEYPTYSIYTQESDTNQLLDDALIVFDYLINQMHFLKENIFIFGRSIGTSPAIYLSSQRKPGALIIVSGFTSIRDATESLCGNFFGKFLKLFVSERFTSIKYIKQVTCPTLFIHGLKDNLIPYEHSQKLKNECRCPSEIHFPEEMTHNEFDYEEDFLNPIETFLKNNTNIDAESFMDIVIPNGIFKIPNELLNKIKEKQSNS